MNLIVVESKGKVDVFTKLLRKLGKGEEWEVVSCNGHYCGLPSGSLGLNIKNGFSPTWKILDRKSFRALRSSIEKSKVVYVATDMGPVGDYLAYHIHLTSSKIGKECFRLSMDSLTPSCLQSVLESPGDISVSSSHSFLSREAIDRFVSTRLSAALSSSLGADGLSRISSLVLTEIARRERSIRKNTEVSQWVVRALLKNGSVATSAPLQGEDRAEDIVRRCLTLEPAYTSSTVKELPPPPFTTSSLLQFMSDRYGFLPSKVMSMCTTLYGLGYITQPYTESFFVPDSFVSSVRSYIETTFGKEFLHDKKRTYVSSDTLSGSGSIIPVDISVSPSKSAIRNDLRTLYSAIWFSAIASQGRDYLVERQLCDYRFPGEPDIVVSAAGMRMDIPGWHQLSGKIFLDHSQELSEFHLGVVEASYAKEVSSPPARHTASSIISWLDSKYVGRPYNYVSSISHLLSSGYAEHSQGRIKITDGGEAVLTFLRKAVPDLIDSDFQAEIEEEIDAVSSGSLQYEEFVKEYWSWTTKAESSIKSTKLRPRILSPSGKKAQVTVNRNMAIAFSPSDGWESYLTFDSKGRLVQSTNDD